VNIVISSAKKVRRLELIVLAVGALIALGILSLGTKSAFRANMAGGHEVDGFLLTTYSLLIMGAVVVSPYAVLAFLGRFVKGDGETSFYQIAGLMISILVTGVSVYLYVDAHHVATHDRSSTAGLVFLAVPMILVLLAGALYGALLLMHSRAQKRKSAHDSGRG